MVPEDKLGSEAHEQVVEIETNGAADLHEFARISAGHQPALCSAGAIHQAFALRLVERERRGFARRGPFDD